MTLLRGHFAMTLVVSGDADAADRARRRSSSAFAEHRPRRVRPRARRARTRRRRPARRTCSSVHGGDRPGHRVGRRRARRRRTAATSPTSPPGSPARSTSLIAEVELPADADVAALDRRRSPTLAGELGVEATLRPADSDLL